MGTQTQNRKPKGRDKDEVRLENPVPKLLQAYGVKTKGKRFVPFCHNTNEYSGKMDDEACYCFSCGKNFDCFGIVGFFEGIENLNVQVAFLGGKDLPEDNPRSKEIKAKAQRLREAKEAENAAKEALKKNVIEKTNKMHEIRNFLRNNKPQEGKWPSKEWADAYIQLQILDDQVSSLLDDNTGANMECFPDVAFV